MVTRSQTGHLKPKQYPGFHLFSALRHPLHALHTCLLPPEPTTFKQAATKHEWVNAMNPEYQALISNNTGPCAQDHLIIMLLEINGCSKSNRNQMVVWIDTKLD